MPPDITDRAMRPYLLQGGFGLEKESLRVDVRGRLAQTPHPFPDDPQIDRDFCENQVELVTTVCDSVKDACRQLEDLTNRVRAVLLERETGPEYLWPFSNPPFLENEAEIPIAVYDSDKAEKRIYREYLAGKYGKRKMLYSGIHFNFSFPDAMLSHMGQREKDAVYLTLAEKAVHYSWLIVLLTAASPLCDRSFFQPGASGDRFRGVASLRCSALGYWNPFVPILRYDSLEAYCDSVQGYLDRGELRAFSELYLPIRVKPRGETSLTQLRQGGITHIELRMLDLNPLDPLGIDRRDVAFLHLFILWLSAQPPMPAGPDLQRAAIRHHRLAASYRPDALVLTLPDGSRAPMLRQAKKILGQMDCFFRRLHLDEAAPILAYQQDKLDHPERRYAARVLDRFSDSYAQKGLALAKNMTTVAQGT